ncbi:hypothetical protein EUTSA_v10002225mg, partial [Eutrema salsugineum]
MVVIREENLEYNKQNYWKCTFCYRVTTGGITRFKNYLIGGHKDVKHCFACLQQHNLHRPAVTRFATLFITFSQFHKQQNNLRKMVTSEKKKANTYLLQDSFWRDVLYAFKVMGPLVSVLSLVDGENKLPVEYIMQKWDCQFHWPLYAAGYFLNPANILMMYIMRKLRTVCNVRYEEVENGLYCCIARLVHEKDIQDKIMDELDAFKNATGLSGINMEIRQRSTKSPAEWWTCYGSSAPNLTNFAIKVLSLTCSTTSCKRTLYKKKKLIGPKSIERHGFFVKYNHVLQRQYKRSDTTDPILLDKIDEK